MMYIMLFIIFNISDDINTKVYAAQYYQVGAGLLCEVNSLIWQRVVGQYHLKWSNG